jgi:hypothetical protein
VFLIAIALLSVGAAALAEAGETGDAALALPGIAAILEAGAQPADGHFGRTLPLAAH